MAGRIEDYAIVGDMQSVALLSTDGSVDWLCLPRFDSEACFAALLGTDDHGQWRIAPVAGTTAATRRYAGDTLILETDWETPDGAVRVTDFMPPRDDDEPPVLVRIVTGLRGTVDTNSTPRSCLLSEEYDPRYGRLVGNMPQAFSHVPLVQTALNLGGHAEEHRRGPVVPGDERRSVPG